MPKDPSKNIDRYKIGGGQLNPFEYQQNQEAISQQGQDNGGDWPGDQGSETSLPPDQAEAERIRQLLAAHGEPAPAPVEQAETTEAGEVTQLESAKKATAGKTAKPAAAPKSAKKAAAQKSGKQTAARKSVKQSPARKKSADKTLARSRKAASSTPRSRATRKTGRKAATKARATR